MAQSIALVAIAALLPHNALAQARSGAKVDVPATVPCRDNAATSTLCLRLGKSAWLAVGGEYRVRAETIDPVNFGISRGPASSSIAHRGLVNLDLHLAQAARFYVQISAAGQSGRKPSERPFDASDPDIAQAFVEIPVRIGDAVLTLKGGRQDLSIGNRLVALRDGVTLKRAFDGIRLDLVADDHRITGFYLQPVGNRPGAFDDRRTVGESFSGISWQLPGTVTAGQWTTFAFERARRAAQFQSASGAERRLTLGLKYQRRKGRWDVLAQTSLQTGRVGNSKILAAGGAADIGFSLEGKEPLRLGIQLGIASGDTNPADGHLGTFDPLYPNLGVYTDAPLYYYANQFMLQANASKAFGHVSLRADATLLGRASLHDAIYVSPGRPLALPVGTSRLSAASFEVSARWHVTNTIELYASALRAEALDAIRAAGGRSTNFALFQMTARY